MLDGDDAGRRRTNDILDALLALFEKNEVDLADSDLARRSSIHVILLLRMEATRSDDCWPKRSTRWNTNSKR